MHLPLLIYIYERVIGYQSHPQPKTFLQKTSPNQFPHPKGNGMEGRKFAITLVSAENLLNVRSVGKMKVFAAVSLNGKSETTKYSDVDLAGGTNPTWGFGVESTRYSSRVFRSPEWRLW